jgi:D-lactate dehydrogenase (cytochrome)
MLVSELAQRFGDRLSTALAVREQHGRDESHHPVQAPDAVLFARSTEEVVAAVDACRRHRVPIIAFGAGTGLEGHVAAVRGGLSLDLSQMNRILRVSAEDLDCTVEAGVTRKQLNQQLRDTGLFFPIDPGADASIGGMAATRASGTNAVRYGTMRDNVLSLQVVTGTGRVVRTARRARKSAAGYDLTRLFVGSEGTLGIITEVTLRLHGIPEAILSAVCPFPTLDAAVSAVIATIQFGISVARVELADEVQMAACVRHSKLPYAERPTLFFEFHGAPAAAKDQAQAVAEIAASFGGTAFEWAESAEDRARLWTARHEALYASKALRPGSVTWATDVCVPISRLAECIAETRRDIDAAALTAPIVGHVGDGNFHVTFVLDPNDPAELGRAQEVNRRMVERAIALDGTCTGEHGVGLGKIPYLRQELGDGVDLMRAIKAALDPDGLFNPGKIFPETELERAA